MTLSERQIERYSRQLLLPEVSGRDQERLLAARAVLVGGGVPADTVILLLGRAGIGTIALTDPLPPVDVGPDCRLELVSRSQTPGDVLVVMGDDATVPASYAGGPAVRAGRRPEPHVLAVVGRPCLACIGPRPRPGSAQRASRAGTVADDLALGALAAAETLRILLTRPQAGRCTTLPTATGEVTAVDLAPTPGCPRCRALV